MGKTRIMKSALFATIIVIIGGVATLLAFPAEDKRAAFEFRQARAELGLPPQIEDELPATPEPVEQYSIVHAKPKTQTPTSRHRQVAHRRLNFLEKLVVSFINLQKHLPAKTATKRVTSATTDSTPHPQSTNQHYHRSEWPKHNPPREVLGNHRGQAQQSE